MARNFKGTNSLDSSYALYYYRTKFANEVYTEGPLGPKCSIDLNFAEFQNYAQLSANGDPVIPNEDKLVGLRSPANPSNVLHVFDFVADMFIDMKTHIELALSSGALCRGNAIFDNFGPLTAYASPQGAYKTYLNNLIANYVTYIIPDIYGKSNIMDFQSFVKNFFVHVETSLQGNPITFTGWLISKLSSISNTGISFTISEMVHSDDNKKVTKLIDTPQFSYYKSLLLNTGLAFDFQNPSIILADLGSPAAVKYYEKYNISSIDNLFDQYYIKSYYKDLDILIDKLIYYYNIFVTTNEYQIKFGACGKKTKWHWEKRTTITAGQADAVFPTSYWLYKLVSLRSYENEGAIPASTIKKIQRNATILEKRFDKSAALDYINNATKTVFYSRDYGFKDLERKLLEKEKASLKEKGITAKSVFNGGGY